jgi:4-hydroxy-3-polyprenylbenzoate decarboxylase
MHILLQAPLPENVMNICLRAFFARRKLSWLKCITQPEIEVPVDADFVIEGYVDPSDELIWEGPFGDHTGNIRCRIGIHVST